MKQRLSSLSKERTMVEVLDKVTPRAMRYYGDLFTEEFYRRLKKKELCTTRCRGCRKLAFPPRAFCPYCFSDQVEWVTLGSRGRLYAFTQQHRALRFNRPDVIGLVELEDGGPRILSRIDARIEELKIGMQMELSFIEISPDIMLHQFRPMTK